MKKGFCIGFAFLLLLFTSFPAAATPDKVYENKTIGIKVSSPEQWTFYASEHNAPEQFKTLFRNSTKQNKLLFMGTHSSQQAFDRLYAEAFHGTALEYFDLLYVQQKANVEIVSARYDVLNDLVQWVFRTRVGQVDLTFVETIAKQGDHVVRLGCWTFTPLFEKYRGDFDRITESTAFLKKVSGHEQWNTSWKDLQGNLEGNNIAYVETLKDTRKEPTLPVCEGEKRPLLWQVKGEKNTVYLFGSIHLGKPEFYPLAASVESAFDRSQHLVVEVDTTSDASQKELTRFMAEARLKKGKTLREMLSPGVYKKLTEEVDKIGVPMDSLATLKPWVMAITLIALKMQAMGYMPDFGVDRYFIDKAKKSKDILELESFNEQVRLFDSIGDEKFLAYTMLSLNSMELEAGKLIRAWLCGDLKTMEAITFEDMTSNLIGDVNEIYEKMYFSRNRKMKEKIKNYLKGDKDYFVVVGAGHLIGDKGIVALLQGEGYTVTR